MSSFELEGQISRLFGEIVPLELYRNLGIVGVGVDTVPIEKIFDHSLAFLEGNFTEGEIEYCQGAKRLFLPRLAARLAGKEAVRKSLGGTDGWNFKEVEIMHAANGVPLVELRGLSRFRAEFLGVETFRLSLEHTESHGLALCIAIGSRGLNNGVDTNPIS